MLYAESLHWDALRPISADRYSDSWGALVLNDTSPDFPESKHSVLLAAVVGKREPLPGKSERSPDYTTLRHVASRTCEKSHCAE